VIAALAGSYLITFSDPGAISASRLAPAAFALGAATLWALGAVLGRYVSPAVGFAELAGLRFCCGLPVAAVLLLALRGAGGIEASGGDAPAILLLALVPGLIALSLYYRGLRHTPASVATLAELAFPLSALLVSAAAFDTVLTGTQLLGTLLLAGTVTLLGVAGRGDDEADAIVVAPALRASGG
jgi:drug/metabolite transporter (DMT)-like permease